MPKCAWLLTTSLLLLLNQTIGAAATLNFAFAAIGWIATTPAALVMAAALAAWHLTSAHTPRNLRRTPARAHP